MASSEDDPKDTPRFISKDEEVIHAGEVLRDHKKELDAILIQLKRILKQNIK